MDIDIEPFTFYEPVKKFGIIENNQFGNGEIVIQKAFRVKMLSRENMAREKQYIQIISNGKPSFLATSSEQKKLIAETKTFGQFNVKIDTISPKIIPRNIKETDSIVHSNKLIFVVNDDQTDIFNYNILVNGEWRPLEYDLKSNQLIYLRKDKEIKWAMIEVLVSDNCGNIGSWKKKLYFDVPVE
jgi:hypothetical protein